MNKSTKVESIDSNETTAAANDCFVIMPIADSEGYPAGHFQHVYDDIIRPACGMAGVNPVRADDVKATNMIHLDILQKLIDAPIAICDLSSRNPNVLFELGLRQAFDKPVVLIQEEKTPKIFDISPLRYLEYSREMRYHDVLVTQKSLSISLKETISHSEAGSGVNSIVKLLALGESAKIPELKGERDSVAFDVLMSEINQMRRFMEQFVRANKSEERKDPLFAVEYERLSSIVDKASINSKIPLGARVESLYEAIHHIDRLMAMAESSREFELLKTLFERAQRAQSKLGKDSGDNLF